MAVLFTFAILAVTGIILWRLLARRFGLAVHDAEGRRVAAHMPNDGARILGAIVLPVLVLMLLATSVRVVPVGHALVIFNTVTKSFRLGRQGVTFVPPFVSATAD